MPSDAISSSRDKAAREKAAREKAAREKAAREKASRGKPGAANGRSASPVDSARPVDAAPQWPELQRRLLRRSARRSVASLWKDWERTGGPLRWGIAAASGTAVPETVEVVSRIAAGARISAVQAASVELAGAAEALVDALARPVPSLPMIAEAVAWGYALPELSERLDQRIWWQLLNQLQSLHRAAVDQVDVELPARLIAGGELGLVLHWRLADLPSCYDCGPAAVEAAVAWFEQGEDAIDAALSDGGVAARLVLASALRTRRLLRRAAKRTVKGPPLATAAELGTWVAAAVCPDATAAFSDADRGAVRDDWQRHGLLLAAAADLNQKALTPAVEAAMGISKSRGRLAWQVRLPEPMLYSAQARLALMLPEWDVRRGRIHIDYSGDQFRLQVFAGRPPLIDGRIDVELTVGQTQSAPSGPWSETCEYSDDDVHYLELEQLWTGGVRLQRQVLLIRDDRCALLADAVVVPDADPLPPVRYVARLPVAQGITAEPEEETRELILGDSKSRAICLPLALQEWRVGPTRGSLDVGPDGAMVLRISGQGNLYAPLWFDFERRRFPKPRTWRPLTVADELRIVTPHEGVAFRVQAGDAHWVVYRSLSGRRPRTFLGRHMVADFFCGRFESSDGYIEELVTVDDEEAPLT